MKFKVDIIIEDPSGKQHFKTRYFNHIGDAFDLYNNLNNLRIADSRNISDWSLKALVPQFIE